MFLKNKIFIASMMLVVVGAADAKSYVVNTGSGVETELSQAQMTPEKAVSLLQDGNKRYLAETPHQRNHREAALLTSKHGQYPFAIVLSCIDSRSNPGLIFDQGIGDIFTTSVAGNVVNSNVLASMEYAVKHSGSKLIVVMGHTQCGAVTAACEGEATGHISNLLEQIKLAVEIVGEHQGPLNCKNYKTVDEIAQQNVLDQISKVLNNSATIRKMVADGKIGIIGAMHNIRTGKVVFFDRTGKSL